MQNFSQLSSKTVTEVLMLEMKMAPAAKAYLISGYPRSMRDVVEYSEKVNQEVIIIIHKCLYWFHSLTKIKSVMIWVCEELSSLYRYNQGFF